MTWFAENIRPASWRGLPFAVLRADSDWSRRVAIHHYPKRETVWVEDLGGGKNPIQIKGFLIGDDVQQQRDAMIRAVQKPGPGELVHPTLGTLKVVCVGFATAESAEAGRVVDLVFTFIESGLRVFPAPAADTRSEVGAAADNLDAAADNAFCGMDEDTLGDSDFARGGDLNLDSPMARLDAGTVAPADVVAPVTRWADHAAGLVSDAASVLDAAGGVLAEADRATATVSRYLRGARIGITTSAPTTTRAALEAAALAREAVRTAGQAAVTLAGRL